MATGKSKDNEYQTFSSIKNGSVKTHGQQTLKPSQSTKSPDSISQKSPDSTSQSLVNSHNQQSEKSILSPESSAKTVNSPTELIISKEPAPENNQISNAISDANLSYSEQQKQIKKEKRAAKDQEILSGDNWLARNGHTFTYIGLYLFSIMVLFRPYQLVPGLGFLSATAFYFAIVTLLIYLPTQFSAEGNLTILTTEVKAVLAMTAVALLTIPIAKSPAVAWEQFNEPFIKAILIFIVMVNVVRTRGRLIKMMGLSLAIGVVLSYLALGMFIRGEMNVEDYRVSVEIGGMFENPNEMSIHLIMMFPLAVTLGIANQKFIWKLVYFGSAIIMLSANMVTYSRGGFLGLIAASAVLVWKLGRKNRIGVTVSASVIGVLLILLAPGNFGLRILSIFIPGLDPVGSSNQRSELLIRSILVSLRNPWGIGIGNFPIVGIQNLVSHNAYTQVSSELGILGLIAYLIFMISPFRKLSAIERTQFAAKETDWFYYLAIGLQASLVAYLVSSFFASIAYNWFIYYLIAYAVAFRRVYQIEKESKKDSGETLPLANFGEMKTA